MLNSLTVLHIFRTYITRDIYVFNLIYFAEHQKDETLVSRIIFSSDLVELSNIFFTNSLLSALILLTSFSFHVKADDDDVVYTKAQLNCFIKHLKKSFFDQKYPEFVVSDPVTDCATFIQSDKKDGYSLLVDALRSDSTKYLTLGCLISRLKKGYVLEMIWLSSIYQASETMTKDEIEQKVSELRSESNSVSDKAKSQCASDSFFGVYFDNFVENSKRAGGHQSELYCMRKHIVAKKLLTPMFDNIAINPDNLGVGYIDCNEVMKTYPYNELTLEGTGLTDEENRCITRKATEIDFTYKMLYPEFLVELGMTDAQIATERQNYIEIMTTMTKLVETCV